MMRSLHSGRLRASLVWSLQMSSAVFIAGLLFVGASGASATGEIPIGSIVPYAGSTDGVPAGWLLCDGSSYHRDSYPRLHQSIGHVYGLCNDRLRFRVPDMSMRFVRGTSKTLPLGTIQRDAIKSHAINMVIPMRFSNTHGSSDGLDGGTHLFVNRARQGVAGSYIGANETRPKCISMHWIIRAL